MSDSTRPVPLIEPQEPAVWSEIRRFLVRFKVARRLQLVLAHAFLLSYTALAVIPVALVVMNSVKSRRAMFRDTYKLPNKETWDLIGYETVRDRGNFPDYFLNSIIVVVGALFLILLLGSMMAFALSEYKFRGNTALSLYMAIGIMIPIRLGTVSLVRLVQRISIDTHISLDLIDLDIRLRLLNTLTILILVYTAQGLPLSIFVLSSFLQDVPKELKDAARIDGASEYRIYRMVLPLVRPALGTVAVFTMIPIWNDLWFPLILAPREDVKTVTLGAQSFLGQFKNDWNAILAALSLSMVPIIILYIIFSRQLVRGLTAGAIKH